MSNLMHVASELQRRSSPLKFHKGQKTRSLELRQDVTIHLKLEDQLQDGSVKEKTARMLVADALSKELIDPKTGLIESTSGNLGVSLAALCARLDIPFTGIVDPNTSQANSQKMRAFGAKLVRVDEMDCGGGYQLGRVSEIKRRLAAEPQLYWTDQYGNPANAAAHETWTGPEISAAFAKVDRVVIAVGTGGTVSGVGRYFQKHSPSTEIVAVDVVGSVTFGGHRGMRFISGPGQSFVPKNFCRDAVTRTRYVSEQDAVIVCHWLARQHGILVGGSTGVAIAGALLDAQNSPDQVPKKIVVISPDGGEKYVSTLFNEEWVAQRFGVAPLERRFEDELRLG